MLVSSLNWAKKKQMTTMYIFPFSRFAGAKMSTPVSPRKITDFARLGEKITGKICDFAILWG